MTYCDIVALTSDKNFGNVMLQLALESMFSIMGAFRCVYAYTCYVCMYMVCMYMLKSRHLITALLSFI